MIPFKPKCETTEIDTDISLNYKTGNIIYGFEGIYQFFDRQTIF